MSWYEHDKRNAVTRWVAASREYARACEALEQYRCAYCWDQPARTLDHIQPRALGGKNNFENLVPVCRQCNRDKGNQTGEIFPYMAQKRGWILFTDQQNQHGCL